MRFQSMPAQVHADTNCVADSGPNSIVMWFFPVGQYQDSLDYLNRFSSLTEHGRQQILTVLVQFLVQDWVECLSRCRQCGSQEK